jgi:hypothetical protein
LAFLNATSKSVANGFEVAPVVTSTTPTICEVVGPKIIFKSVGRCGLSAYVDGNGVFERSNTATTVLNITN